jgi:predicted RNA-binding Zn-ribbon protein involved in translation (DUF1610 family)
MPYPTILHRKQCPHCGTNLVAAEMLLPHTCEPGAFHSRLLGILENSKVVSWQCPDCMKELGTRQ